MIAKQEKDDSPDFDDLVRALLKVKPPKKKSAKKKSAKRKTTKKRP